MSAYDSEGDILYTLVARGNKVLAEYTNKKVVSGNFPRIALKVLEKIPPQDGKCSYTYDSFLFNYLVDKGITFLSLTDEGYSRYYGFEYLKELSKVFNDKFKEQAMQAKTSYALNDQFKPILKEKMTYYNSEKANKFKNIRDKIEETKDLMIQNIDKALERGEKLDILVEKTGDLNQNSQTFKNNAKKLKNQVWWQNFKICIMILIVLAALLFLGGGTLFLYFCNGFACVASQSKTPPADDS